MRTHEVSNGGVRLHVREWGRADGPPILFVHGWSQCHMCWIRQSEGPLAAEFRLVAFDLRGHGMSDRPMGPEDYADARLWAGDLAAVIDGLRLDRPVLVAWSYGGLVACDYLRAYGQDRIGAIDFVGAAVRLGPAAFGTLIGPGFLEPFADATADDLPANVAAMRRFVRGCAHRPLDPDLLEAALCWNMVVPPRVRAALGARTVDSDDVLRRLTVPVLVTHGREDTVVLPAMGEHVLATCPAARASWYPGVGHMPFLEDPDRFDAELADLARRAHGAVLARSA